MTAIDIQPHIEKQIAEITKTATFLRSREDVRSKARQTSDVELCKALETAPAQYLRKQASWQLAIMLCAIFDPDTNDRVTLRKFANSNNVSSEYEDLERKHESVLGNLRNFRNSKVAHLIPTLAEKMKSELWLHEVLDLANDTEDLVEKIAQKNFAGAGNTWLDECLNFWRNFPHEISSKS
jgi:hypothetical protein